MKTKFFLYLILFIFIFSHPLWSSDWILGARRFDFTQNRDRDSSENELAVLMPTLIMEQIAQGLNHTTSYDELLARSLEDCRTERISLFLQLSKEVKVRDTVVLYGYSKRKQKKQILECEKKIQDIQKKIDEVQKKEDQYKADFLKKTDASDEKNGKIFINPFSKESLKRLFVLETNYELEDVSNEPVKFYRNDTTKLFTLNSNDDLFNPLAPESERYVLKEKINGLITGTLVVYGNYFSVTCSLYAYPGRSLLGTVTEVGSLKEIFSVADRVAQYIVPLVTNSNPIELYFDILPEECRNRLLLTLDGNIYKGVPDKLILNSGIHSIGIECEGYHSQSVSYDFKNSSRFILQSELKEEVKSDITLTLMDPVAGSLYYDGALVSSIENGVPGGQVNTNGSFALGVFQSDTEYTRTVTKKVNGEDGKFKIEKVQEDGGNLSFFYSVPEKLQNDNTILGIKGKAVDTDSIIEKRRKWTYRAYSLLVLSMPYTLYSVGKYNGAVAAYNDQRINSLDDVNTMKINVDISSAISITCAGFFVFELCRYLMAANKVLPHKVQIIENDDFEVIVKKSKNNPVPDESVSEMQSEESVSEELSIEENDGEKNE